ncbi:hypothetical protein ES703_91329 [subsurface metagenome]
MMPGMIMLWAGAIVDIPSGWHLCDGDAGTIDLRNKFIVAAGDTYPVADTGGAINHSHPFTGDGHIHAIWEGLGIEAGHGKKDTTESANVIGTTDNQDGRPPYYALAYIQKL